MAGSPFNVDAVNYLDVVVVGPDETDLAILVQKWAPNWHYMYQHYSGQEYHLVHESYMGRKYVLRLYVLVEGAFQQRVVPLLVEAAAVVLVYDHRYPRQSEKIISDFIPRARHYAFEPCCFLVENHYLGCRRGKEKDVPVDPTVKRLFDSLPSSRRKFVRHFADEELYDSSYTYLTRQVFDMAKWNYKARTCSLLGTWCLLM